MHRLLLLLTGLSLAAASAQEIRSAQAVLQERLLRMEAERDRSERAFLELQAETQPLLEDLSREKGRLRDELEQVRQQNFLLDSAQDVATRAGDRTREELESVRDELRRVQEQLVSEQEAFAATLNQLQEDQQRASGALETDRAEREAEQSALRERLNDLLDQMAETEETAQRIRAERAALEQEARDIQGLNRQLELDLETSRRQADLATAQLTALQTRVGQLEDALEEAQAERSRAELQRDQMAMRVQQLEGELEAMREATVPRAELEAMQAELEASRERNQALESALREEQARPDFREQLAIVERERDLLDAQMKTMETRMEDARRLARHEQARREEVSEANTSLMDHIAALEASLQALESGRETQAGEVRGLLEEREALQEALETQRRELGEEIESLLQAAEAASAVQNEFDSLQVDYLSLQTELDEQRIVSREQAEAIDDLQRALGASMQEVERTRREMEMLRSEGASPEVLHAERLRFEQAREDSLRDMRTLARHIQRLRTDLQQQRTLQQEAEQQRQLLLNRIRELESGSATP